jgi:ATP-dependent Clp protease adaptor protein ClpS
MSSPTVTAQTESAVDTQADDVAEADRPWVTVVWNDPVNLMNYVTHVFMKVFGYSEDKATKLMLDVHQLGKAIVSSGPRERMEGDTATLHGYGLWATIQRDS